VVLVVIGGLTTALAVVLLIAAGILAATTSGRDADGYLTNGPATLRSDGYAVAAREIGVQFAGPDIPATRELLGKVRVTVAGNRPGTPVFVGIAPRADVDRYLAGVRTDDVRDFDLDPVVVTYDRHEGGAPATPPGAQTFWTVSDAGTGDRAVTWDIRSGDWAIVIMNADGSAGVDADVSMGASLPALRLVAIGLLAGGGLLLVIGVALVVVAVVTRPRTA
jgi:hypothetical protein